MECAKFIVSGTVQGVYFRASTRARAMELGLTGYAKNRVDGSVEVIACGASDALDELERWLHIGPPAARVSEVVRCEADEWVEVGFQTL